MTVPAKNEPEDQPGVASVEGGVVLLDGPKGVAVALTPDAASITGYSLIAAAEEARRYLQDA